MRNAILWERELTRIGFNEIGTLFLVIIINETKYRSCQWVPLIVMVKG